MRNSERPPAPSTKTQDQADAPTERKTSAKPTDSPEKKARERFSNPLCRARAGQWVKYRMQNGMQMKQTIAKVDGPKITIRNEMWMKGTPLPPSETVVDLNAGQSGGAVEPSEFETLTIQGKKLECIVMRQNDIKTYMCDQIPVYGVVRSEMNGQMTMELLDWND